MAAASSYVRGPVAVPGAAAAEASSLRACDLRAPQVPPASQCRRFRVRAAFFAAAEHNKAAGVTSRRFVVSKSHSRDLVVRLAVPGAVGLLGWFGLCCASMMPFFIIELGVWVVRTSRTRPFRSWKAIWTETHNRGGGWLPYRAKPYWTMPSRDLVETRCRLQLSFGSVTQAFDSIMGRFNLGELTGNKLLS